MSTANRRNVERKRCGNKKMRETHCGTFALMVKVRVDAQTSTIQKLD